MAKPSTARRRIRTLERRRDYLKGLLDDEVGCSRDSAEFAALCWAIRVIEENWGTAKYTSGEWRAQVSA